VLGEVLYWEKCCALLAENIGLVVMFSSPQPELLRRVKAGEILYQEKDCALLAEKVRCVVVFSLPIMA
jgi:hypothetical protein